MTTLEVILLYAVVGYVIGDIIHKVETIWRHRSRRDHDS